MSRPDLPTSLENLAQANADLQLSSEVIRALLIRIGGEAVITKDDLFVARRSSLQVADLHGGGLALRLILPAVIPTGPAEFGQ